MIKLPVLGLVIIHLASCTPSPVSQTSQPGNDQLSCSELLMAIELARQNAEISRSDELTTRFRRQNCSLDADTGGIIETTESSSPEMQELNRLFGRGLISESEYNEAVERLSR